MRGRTQQEPPVPNLPGYQHVTNQAQQIATALAGTRKAKTSTLKYVHNYPVVEESVAPMGDKLQLHRYNKLPHHGEAVLDPVPEPVQPKPKQSSSLQWTGVKTPGWLMYDKKVLRFFAYSTDKVLYSPVEEVRYRRFEFRYFMEDSTLQVIEPQEPNSGLPQGTYLQRHKVKLADGSILTHDTLRVGGELTIYSRRFVIVGCDAATRQFFADHLLAPQPQDMPMPAGKYDLTRKAQEEAEAERRTRSLNTGAPKPPGSGDDPFEDSRGPGAVFEFFEDRKVQEHLDRKLLRFYCCWDNTKRVYGEKLGFALHYYLKDDTVEVAEVHRRNTGRDPYPLLLSRCKLPKTPNIPSIGGRPLSPRSKRNLNIQYYHWTDFRIGAVVKVYGRELLIYDMDVFTRSWLQEQLGLSDTQLQPLEVDFDMGPKRPPLQVPPNTLGIGTDEDSLQNVLYLIPKRPIRDSKHYLENWNKVLRFTARMVPVPGKPLVGPFDGERRFVVSFFLLDNTLSIFEPKRPNIRGGMFLERMKAKKDGQAEYFTDQDFHVGAVICVYARHFELMDTDSYTLRHMEANPDRYPWADYDKVHNQVMSGLMALHHPAQELRHQLGKQDTDRQGALKHAQVKAALQACGISITAHETLTLVRHLAGDADTVTIDQLLHGLHLLAPPPSPPPPAAHHHHHQHGHQSHQYADEHRAHDQDDYPPHHEYHESQYPVAPPQPRPGTQQFITGSGHGVLHAQSSYDDTNQSHDQGSEQRYVQQQYGQLQPGGVSQVPGLYADWADTDTGPRGGTDTGPRGGMGVGGGGQYEWQSQPVGAAATKATSLQVQPTQQVYGATGRSSLQEGQLPGDARQRVLQPGRYDVSVAVAECGSVRDETRSVGETRPGGDHAPQPSDKDYKVSWPPELNAASRPPQPQRPYSAHGPPVSRPPPADDYLARTSKPESYTAWSDASDSRSMHSRDQLRYQEQQQVPAYAGYDHVPPTRGKSAAQGYGDQRPVVISPPAGDYLPGGGMPGRGGPRQHAPGVKYYPGESEELPLGGGSQPVVGGQAGYVQQHALDTSIRRGEQPVRGYPGGKENQGVLGDDPRAPPYGYVRDKHTDLKDMRFVTRPGSGIGSSLSSSSHQGSHASLSVHASRPNSSVMDTFAKHKQPSSLWQTTNAASGGVHRGVGHNGR